MMCAVTALPFTTCQGDLRLSIFYYLHIFLVLFNIQAMPNWYCDCIILVFIKSSLSLSCTYVRIIDALSINKDQLYTGLLAVWTYLLHQGTLK